MKLLFQKIRNYRNNLLVRRKDYEELIHFFRNPPSKTENGLNVSPLRYAEPELNKRSEFLHELIKERIKNKDKILELGCGIGRNLSYLEKQGYSNLFGVDINQEAITLSTETYENLRKLQKNLVCSSLETGLKGYEDIDFNLIFTMCCLMHIHPAVEEEVFDQIARITKDYLLTIEMETSIHDTHFPRNYKKIFEARNFIQEELFHSDDNIKDIFGDVTFRLFKRI